MKEIKLTQNKIALVDDEDYEYLSQFKWRVTFNKTSYYAVRWANRRKKDQKLISMHRDIMNTPSNLEIDHIDHDTLNNQKSNLRNCTHLQNKRNTIKRENKTSKYLGVHLVKFKNTASYRACIYIMKRRIDLGYFKDEKLAAMAYDKKARELFGEFANLNFPYEP